MSIMDVIDRMLCSNKECPTCRKKLVSKRSLRPDPNFDALIAKVVIYSVLQNVYTCLRVALPAAEILLSDTVVFFNNALESALSLRESL
jgi:hypothetical protein